MSNFSKLLPLSPTLSSSIGYDEFAVIDVSRIPDGSNLMNELAAFESKDIKLIPETTKPRLTRGRTSLQRYMCGECGKGYSWMANLRRHQRLECGKLPKHHCRICRREFYRRYELTNHYNTKHTAP